MYILQHKLKALKVKIKNWSGSSRNGNRLVITRLEAELQTVMGCLESEGPTESLRLKRVQVIDDLWKQYWKEESFWIQKSRFRWEKEGDKNSAFFHAICKKRQARKSIESLAVGGEIF